MTAFLTCFIVDKNICLTFFHIDKNDSGKQIQRKIFFKSLFFFFNALDEWVCDTRGKKNGVSSKSGRWSPNITCSAGSFLFLSGQKAEDLHELGKTLFPLKLRKPLATALRNMRMHETCHRFPVPQIAESIVGSKLRTPLQKHLLDPKLPRSLPCSLTEFN